MALIKCPECRSDISEQAPFCPICGFPFKENQQKIKSPYTEQNHKEPSAIKEKPIPHKSSHSLSHSFIFIFILLSIFIIKSSGIIKFPIVNGTIHVASNTVVHYDYNAHAFPMAKVYGSFQASGGIGNDIKFLIMTMPNYQNYINNHSYISIYKSFKKSADQFDVLLPFGTSEFVLVFDNSFSLFSSKTVKAQIYLM